MAEKLEIVISARDSTGGVITSISTKFKNLGASLTRAGGIMTAAITGPLVAMGTLAISAASDLEESLNKVRVVFGDSAGVIEDFAQTAANSLGMSSQQALEAAGTFGNLFTAMGIGQDTSAGMSTQLLTLAADLASFNNIDPTIALEKLRAGLVGEVEPLRTLGVNLSAAAVESKALELGLIKQGEELTAAAKAQASFALIMEQTANAQGDFARTSDGLANSTRIVKAQFLDAAAALGQQLLPIGLQIVTFLRDLMDRFNNLSPGMQKTILIIGGIVAAIGPALVIIGSLISALGAIIPVVAAVAGILTFPLIAIIGVVVAVIAGLALAWKNNWFDIRGKTQEVVTFIQGVIQAFLDLVRAWWQEHGDSVMIIVQGLWNGIQTIVQTVTNIISGIIQMVQAAWRALWEAHGTEITTMWQRSWETIKTVFISVSEIIGALLDAFAAAFQGDWEGFGENLRIAWDAAWNAIKSILSTAWENLKTIAGALIADIKTAWVAFLDGLSAKWSGIWGAIEGRVSTAKSFIMGIVQAIIDAIQRAFDLFDRLKGLTIPDFGNGGGAGQGPRGGTQAGTLGGVGGGATYITLAGGVNFNVPPDMNGRQLFEEFIDELSRQTRLSVNAGASFAGE